MKPFALQPDDLELARAALDSQVEAILAHDRPASNRTLSREHAFELRGLAATIETPHRVRLVGARDESQEAVGHDGNRREPLLCAEVGDPEKLRRGPAREIHAEESRETRTRSASGDEARMLERRLVERS